MNMSGFLNQGIGDLTISKVSTIIADNLLGESQLSKILLRYCDMRDNFDRITYDEWDKVNPEKVWRFSSGVTPYRDYDDTTNVPIPISFSEVKKISDNAVTSLDLPTWFNLDPCKKRVMLLSQDPMPRSLQWYGECRDSICSSPFGLHSKSWREKRNGGGRMWGLVEKLIEYGCSVYLTDAYKFYFQSFRATRIAPTKAIINLYIATFLSEVEMYRPDVIVAFGNETKMFIKELQTSSNFIFLPHFSGRAHRKIKGFFNVSDLCVYPINSQIEDFAQKILESLQRDKCKHIY